MPKALDDDDPAAEVNALAAAGLGARVGLICFGSCGRSAQPPLQLA